MREIDYGLIPDGYIAVLTLKDMSSTARFYSADFRDQKVAVFIPTGNYIGISKNGDLKLCQKITIMRDGLILSKEDTKTQEYYQQIKLTPDNVMIGPLNHS